MGLKSYVQKNIFGFDQQQFTRNVANLVNSSLYQWIGAKQEILVSDNFCYIVNGYMNSPAVYEAVSLLVDKIAACPIYVYEVVNENKLKEYKNLIKSGDIASLSKAAAIKTYALREVDVPRIRTLLEKPNDNQTPDQFIRLLSTLLLLTGNALVYGVAGDKRSEKKNEMWALPFSPLQFSIISDGIFDPITAYRCIYNNGDSKLNFDAKDIAHFKTVNPLFSTTASQLYGMSPLHAYRLKLLRSKLSDGAVNKLMENGFKMGLISPKSYESGNEWGSEQKKGLKEAIIKALGSNDSYSRFIPSQHPIEYTPIGLDSTEMGINEQDKADRESIYRAYKIPLNYASTDSSTYNNEEQAGKKLVYNGVAPHCENISDTLTKFICEPFEKVDGKKYIIRLDYMSLPELSVDMKQISEWLDKSPEITWNERREIKGFGKLDLPGMDMPIGTKNMATLKDIVEGKTGNASGSGNSNVNSNNQ